MKYTYEWDADYGIAECWIRDGDCKFYGHAVCHPDDDDFMSERTGCYIAEVRAGIKRLKWKRREAKLQLKTLKTLYRDMLDRSDINPDGLEMHYFNKRINEIAQTIAEIEQDIRFEESYLADYIANKDIMYQKIRKANAQ